jgi:MFS transporter, putative metabolite:H+ symporter
MTAPLTPNQVAARLDRLPVGRFHRRFLFLIALGAWFDYYDNFVAGSLAVILPAAGVLPATRPGEWLSPVGMFTAALSLGMFLGTMFLGMASDYLGRRFGFVAMLLLYSLATLAGGAGYYPLAAVAGSAAGLGLLIVSRLLAGAGIGAENVIIDAYVSELVPRQVRGRSVALAHAFAFTAVPAAALLARLLAPKGAEQGWWLLLVLGSLGALLTWYFRRNLPESPRWLAAAGRAKEAADALARIEAAVERDTGRPLPAAEEPARAPAPRVPFRVLWSPAYRGRTLLLIVFQLLQTVGYYGFMHWLATLLEAKGFGHDATLSMQFAASVLAPVGPLLAAWSCERWQRKWLIAGLALALAGALLAFAFARDPTALTLIAAGVVVGLNWFSAVFHAYQAELFPTEARATGIGFTYAWSRASMVAVSLAMPGLIALSVVRACGVMAAALVGVAGAIGVFGPVTNARRLEDVAG